MKEMNYADVYGTALQKTLDQDMADVATEMVTGTGYNSGKKVKPAYEQVDSFKRMEYETRIRLDRQNEKSSQSLGLIQPNDPSKPRTMVVLPNE